MAGLTHLNKAPIKEAIIAINVKPETPIDLEKVKAIHQQIASSYPDVSPIYMSEIKLRVRNSLPGTESDSSLRGYMFKSADYIIQMKVDGFIASKLAPYNGWDSFKEEAFKLWQIYAAVIGEIEGYSRLAVRYINSFEIPMTEKLQFKLEEYFAEPPHIPEELGDRLSEFFSRVVIPVPDLNAKVVLVQASGLAVGDSDKNKVAFPVIVDIDVYRNSVASFNEEEVWEYIEKLRFFKNKAFFSSITDKTVELLK
ncbi:MAG: TIGR04255 family protein [Pseudomonadales bacterium]|nr:TIGR04255 family protein [Pseudomonadales bacterium]